MSRWFNNALTALKRGGNLYWSQFIQRGRPDERTRNLHDLLRLTLGAVEMASTRREVLDATRTKEAESLPQALRAHHHAVYETTVVYEFSQLAREDFAVHGNVAVWERPIAWLPPHGQYWRSGHIDMSLFSTTRDVETRIEFGKAEVRANSRPLPRDMKLEEDARKLAEVKNERRASKAEPQNLGLKDTENFVVIWDERSSRGMPTNGKLTEARGLDWLRRCRQYAQSATNHLGTVNVTLEAVAASTLLTFAADAHRSAFIAIYSVDI